MKNLESAEKANEDLCGLVSTKEVASNIFRVAGRSKSVGSGFDRRCFTRMP